MSSDAGSVLEPPERRKLWELPNIRDISVRRVRYNNPRKHVLAGKVVEYSEGVEILVETDAEIPMRALSPALNVGSTELTENQQTSETTHRFFVLDEGAVRPGDAIRLGWAGQPPPDDQSEYRYEPPGDVIDEPPDD